MAYLHCHSCDWSQDDFWSMRYNIFTKIWSDIKWLIRPRALELDQWIINDITEYVNFKVSVWGERPCVAKVFSWSWLLVEIVKDIKNAWNMKWKTWKSWKRDRETAVCPQCGNRNFDID